MREWDVYRLVHGLRSPSAVFGSVNGDVYAEVASPHLCGGFGGGDGAWREGAGYPDFHIKTVSISGFCHVLLGLGYVVRDDPLGFVARIIREDVLPRVDDASESIEYVLDD